MAFTHALNTFVQDCNFTDVQGDFNTFNITEVSDSEAGLDDLLAVIAPGAGYDSEERDPPPKCHPGTRVEILQDLMGWVDAGQDTAHGQVLWLHGPAGAGKSAIAQTICERCAERGDLAASFFFSRGKRDSGSQVFSTIAFHLAMSIPGQRQKVRDAIDDDPLVLHRSIRLQIRKLIVETLQVTLAEPQIKDPLRSKLPSLIVVDGLDECKRNDTQVNILAHILDLVRTYSLPLRFMVFSRPEPHIRHCFHHPDLDKFTRRVSLYGDHESRGDIRTYLVGEFERIYTSEKHSATFSRIPRPFPSVEDLELLVYRSDGYFIYAATVVRYVDEEYFSPVKRLRTVLGASSSSSAPFDELDSLYRQVLSTCRDKDLVRKILGFILTPRSTKLLRTGSFITQALGLQPDQPFIALRGLHSIISHDLAEDTFSPYHASLHDFIFDPDRAGNLYIDPRTNHAMIVRAYLDRLKTWHKTTTPFHDLRSEEILEGILFHLQETGACDDATVEELTTTSTHFWFFHFNVMDPLNDMLSKPDAEFLHWLTEAIHIFEGHRPPSHVVLEHFRSLRRTALRCGLAWMSAFGYLNTDNIARLTEKVSFFDPEFIPQKSDQVLKNWQPDYLSNDLFLNFESVQNINYDAHAIHTQLATQCLRMLQSASKTSKLSKYWISAYIYSRIFWAGHVSRVHPGDAELLLFQLRKIEDSFEEKHYAHLCDIVSPNIFAAIEGYTGSEVQRQLLNEPGHCVNRILDEFDSAGGSHGKPLQLSFSGLPSRFRKSDCENARLVIQWLKKMPDPPEDEVTRWERRRYQYLAVLEV